MANYPKKLMDPTEAALSAIQEALNVRDDEERQPAPPDDHEIPLASSVDALPQTEPATPAPDQAIPETPQTPTNSLSKQIEVTGFRFVTPANKKPEIHYLVVNHSALALNDVTVFVTLHAGNAKPGQPPLSRFSFRAPNVPAFESKEMSSTIEKISQPMALPEWQDVKVDVTIGQ